MCRDGYYGTFGDKQYNCVYTLLFCYEQKLNRLLPYEWEKTNVDTGSVTIYYTALGIAQFTRHKSKLPRTLNLWAPVSDRIVTYFP